VQEIILTNYFGSEATGDCGFTSFHTPCRITRKYINTITL